MNIQGIIEITRNTLTETERQGISTVEIKDVKALLTELETLVTAVPGATAGVAPQANLEHYKAQLAVWIEQHKHLQAWNLENFRSVLMLGQGALKSIILINGGAAVALLAFLGHALDKGPITAAMIPTVTALYNFVLGVLVGAIATGTTYVSQTFYGASGRAWYQPVAMVFHGATVILAIFAYSFFFYGAYHAYYGFIALK